MSWTTPGLVHRPADDEIINCSILVILKIPADGRLTLTFIFFGIDKISTNTHKLCIGVGVMDLALSLNLLPLR